MEGIELFVPTYPYPDDPNLVRDIVSKFEFNNLWANPKKDKEATLHAIQGQFYSHQLIIMRYMMQYDRVFLNHKPGTGKTKVFFVCSESLRKRFLRNESNIKRCIILTNNQDDAKAQLRTSSAEPIKESDRRNYYRIMGYIELSNEIQRIIRTGGNFNDYDDTLYIVDEAHHLKSATDLEVENLEGIKNLQYLFDQVKRSKIIVATGTSMVNDVSDCIPLLNFLLPKDKKLPDNFFTKVPENQRYGILKARLAGKISFVRELESGVDLNYINKHSPSTLNIYGCEMSPFQRGHYLNLDKSEKSEAARQFEREASNFVFPDGKYGKDGVSEHIKVLLKKSQKSKGTEESKATGVFEFKTPGLFRVEESLESGLRKYSNKFANIVRLMKTMNGNCFGYSELKVSGVNILGCCLKANGVEEFNYKNSETINTLSKKMRYGLYTRDSNTKFLRRLEEIFNHPKNKDGEYIKILIGSKIAGEGKNFMNIQNVFLLDANWNESKSYQGISRGLRTGSHRDIINDLIAMGVIDPVIKVNVFQMASIISTPPIESIDVEMYRISKQKDIEIKKVDRMFKQLSFDCVLNKPRNVRKSDKDFSPQCDYQKCDYKCDPAVELTPLPDTSEFDYFKATGKTDYSSLRESLSSLAGVIDFSSYELLYSDSLLYNIENAITMLLTVNENKFSIQDMYNSEFNFTSKYIVNEAISRLIHSRVHIRDRYGFEKYPIVKGDYLILVDNPISLNLDYGVSNFYFDNKVVVSTDKITNSEPDYIKEVRAGIEQRSTEYGAVVLEKYRAYVFGISFKALEALKAAVRNKKAKSRGKPGKALSHINFVGITLPVLSRWNQLNGVKGGEKSESTTEQSEESNDTIIFHSVFIKSLDTGNKMGYTTKVAQVRCDLEYYYESRWVTLKIPEKEESNDTYYCLRYLIESFYANNFGQYTPLFGSVYPDEIFRLHTTTESKQSTGAECTQMEEDKLMALGQSEGLTVKKDKMEMCAGLLELFRRDGRLYVFEEQ